MSKHKAIAEEIIRQIGGAGRLKAFIGAKDLVFGDDDGKTWVQFKFKGSKISNFIKIILRGDDTYTVEFSKIGRKREGSGDFIFYSPILRPVETFEGIYCDSLVSLFERTTGLYLSF